MTTTILVPGAWMAGWIWAPTVTILRSQGINAETITLDNGDVGLADHVQQLIDFIDGEVILVSHSYSGMVTASAADCLGEQVRGLIHVGSFLPVHGHSLLDAWGTDPAARIQEQMDIEAAGGRWLAPTRMMLEAEDELTPEQRDFLADNFTSHPGRTVSESARMSSPVENQPSSYLGGVPPVHGPKWRLSELGGGHWPMLTRPEQFHDLLLQEISRYLGESSTLLSRQ